MKRTIALLLTCVLMAAALTACAPAAPAADSGSSGGAAAAGDTIKIGGLAPLTGAVSQYGIAVDNGAKLAVAEINAAGGVLGKQIEYFSEDEKGDATEAVNAYNKLVQNEGVVAIIGDVTSGPTLAVAQQSQKDGIPMITPSGTQDDITAVGPNVFRTCFNDSFQGTLMAIYASEEMGVKTAAVLYDNANDYSVGLKDAFVAKAAEVGVNVVAEEAYATGDVDFKAQLTKVAAQAPEVIFLPDYYQTIALIAPQARETGITATLLGADGWSGILEQMDSTTVGTVEGSVYCDHYSPENPSDRLAAFIDSYKAEYGMDPMGFSANAYDAVYMLCAAIEQVGGTDAAALCDALATMKYDGITGTIEIDENRNPIKQAAINTIENSAVKFLGYFNG